MLKIRPLNRDSLSDEDAPVLRKELQEEIALEMYNNALRLEAKEQYQEARDLLFKLINENIPQLENQGGLPKSMSTLKYSCYLNIGNIFLADLQNDNALDNYLIASELDETDVTLWYKIGKLALKENRFRQSIYAFSKGLECNESHWPCLDEIISLLFAVRDTISCLFYIGKALILDADYTKGLVFRKQIYKDNPAAKEYYRKSNPDHLWEPPLGIEIDKDDEVKYLTEVQCIIDRINDAEKALASKPLSTIPLPKALESYSWVAVCKSVISLYQYVKTNEMSFFTFVDINKCMSQLGDDMFEVKVDEKPTEVCEEVKNSENPQNCRNEEKMVVEDIVERRFSQNSEENGTPTQTDNDEEQQAEQDAEEQEERNEKSRPRGYKRKRDLLLDLRVWGWHSKRKHVRKTKPDKFYTVEDCLNQILPPRLLHNKVGDASYQEDSMNTMDIYNMFLEDRQINVLSPIHSPQSTDIEPYFGTDKEKEDIIKSWTRPREYCDTCILVKEFIFGICSLWHIKWPKELIAQYIQAYEIYREFYELPNLYDVENEYEDIRNETLATLLYAEFVLFSCPKKMETERMLHIGQIQFLETMTTCWEQNWGEEYVPVFLRVCWIRAYIHRKEGNNESSVRFLQLIQELLIEEERKRGEKYCLLLPNCNKCGFISIEVATKILKHLDMIKSISCLESLYNQEKYKEVAEIVKSTFASNSGCPTFGKVGRPAQLGMLLHALWFTDFDQCFIWSEECLYEAHAHYNRPGQDRTRWEKVVEKCLSIMHEIIKQKSRDMIDLLHDNKKARLTETLAKIICKQINSENAARIPLNTVIPWILLHHLLAKNEEKEMKENKRTKSDDEEDSGEDTVPSSLSILFSAHEFLGPKSWCLVNQGELLHYILDVLLDREDIFKYENLREKLDIQIEQALFCLYQHPSKKNKISRHLADHNVDPLPLTWEKSFQLYEFYAPEVLPEFNSFKKASISIDLEQLLLRITALVNPECDPSVSIPKINEYLQGKTDKIPEPIEFPNRIRAIYYLLGDYYFKLRDFVRCVKYFLMDLSINPQRIDSWACLGLSFFSQLEIKLNFCKKIKNEEEFLEKAKCAQVGFTTALKLSPDDITLWIEFGTFEYMAHSFCSRYLKFESENMSMERFEYLENQKNSFLDSSGQSFEKAIALYEMNDNEPDERWLQYYILGKIAEKKQTEPNEYLNYYLTASQLLHENSATYPDKIMYNSPQYLSVEALELHYRINASILKYLELHEGKEIHNTIGTLFKKTLDALAINRKLAAQRAQKKLERDNQKKAKLVVQQNVENEKGKPDEVALENEININEDEKMMKDKLESTEKSENVEIVQQVPEDQNKPAEQVPIETIEEPNKELEETAKNVVESPEVREELDDAMEKEIKESVDNLLQKVQEMSNERREDNNPVVQVVDEVILLDADYDVIMILSSDEDDDDEISNNTFKEVTPNEDSVSNLKESKSETKLISAGPSKVEYPENIISEKNIENQKSDESTAKEMQCNEKEISADTDTPMEMDLVSEDIPNDSGIGVQENSELLPQSREKDDRMPQQITSGVDVQKVLDKMMLETMQKSSEQQVEIDSDTSIVDKSIEVIDCSLVEENKDSTLKAEENVVVPVKELFNDSKNKNMEKPDIDDNKKLTEESSSSSSSSGSSDSSSSSDSDSDDDSSSSSSSSSSDDSTNENLSKSEILHLVDRCIKGLEQCIIRLPKNYKAIYRLVHLFFNYKAKKDLNKCKQLLLGEYKCYETSTVTGLFADRKAVNFFNGIWRIPSSEIDRPGSLAAHMSRCVTMLLQVLRATNDCKILLDLHFQLKKNPDPDKVYIKDSERLQFSEQALSLCIQTFKNSMKNADNSNNTSMRKLLHDIYRAYIRIQKHVPEKESSFGQMLIEVYKTFIKEKIPDNVNILELAIKFCQQTKIMEKHKNLMAAQKMSPQNPLVPLGPVLPNPSTILAGGMTSVKRSSGSGRPRGRPPLTKVPSQPKISRGKSPCSSTSIPSNWKKSASEQTIAYEYFKHYQEELMKQYNQNLNYMQMAQLYSNPNTFASAYLQAQQSSMLSAGLLNQLSTLGVAGSMANEGSNSQVNALQSKFNEMLALVKKGPALGNFSIDQLMASTSLKSSSSKMDVATSSSSSVKTITTPSDPETKTIQDKSKHVKGGNKLDISNGDKSTTPIELTTKSVNAPQSKALHQTKVFSANTAQNSCSAQREKKNLSSGPSISSMSSGPRENISKSESGNEYQLLKLGATISKVPTNVKTPVIPNRASQELLGTNHPLSQMEATLKKIPSSENVGVPAAQVSSTIPAPPFSGIIMPPPGPFMPPPNSLSISNLSPSGGSPGTKLPSPGNKLPSPGNKLPVTQKAPSPIGIKESCGAIPRLNIEASISRVSPTNLESHRKHSKERNTPPMNAQMSNLALEVGLTKFPSSLSMTPVNVPVTTVLEPNQSITVHKLPTNKTDSYLSKISSSITLTPSLPKSGSTVKHTSSEGYNKSTIEYPTAKSGSQLSPTASNKTSVSLSKITKPTHYSNQNFPKLSNSIEVQSRNVLQTPSHKSSKTTLIPMSRKSDSNPVLTPFSIESMLQSSVKPRIPSSTNLTYNYAQPPTQKVAHTSVITSTSVSSSGNKTNKDHKITSIFTHPSPMGVSGRNPPKSCHGEVKNIDCSNAPSSSKTGPRTPSSDFYQDVHSQMSSIYSSARQDKNVNVSKPTMGTPTSVISIAGTSPTPSYISPSSSPGKTLQEKLADKKREQANKQLFQQIEQHKNTQKPSKDAGRSLINPHPISKMLSYPSSGEIEITKVPSMKVSPNTTVRPFARRRKSSSDDSVIFLE